MVHSDIKQIAHVVDKSYSIKRNGEEAHFNTSNYPMNLVRKDAAGIKKELKLDERRLKLVDVLDQQHANKLVARGKKLIKNITNNKCWEIENAIISLQAENSQLENEILN